MILASIEGTIVFLLIAGVVGVLKFFTKKQEEKKEQEEIEYRRRQLQENSPQNRPVSSTTQQSEEERLRKFLEALGVPTPPSRTPSVPRPAPTPPSPQQRPIPPPRTAVPPPVQPRPQVQYRKAKVATQQQQRPVSLPPKPKPQPVFEKEMASMESGDLGSLLSSGTSIEQIRKDFDDDILPDMEVSATTKANDKLVASAYVLPATEFVPSANTGNLIAALRSAQNLRTLILVREILGPPPSLQNS